MSSKPIPLMTHEVQHKKVGRTIAKNGMANVLRLGIMSVVALIIPGVLVRFLSPQNYNAWILVLQLGTYVGFLEFGVVTAVSKYIAEYDAKSDPQSCSRILSSAVVMLCGFAVLGTAGICILASMIPRLFPLLPHDLIAQVRWGVIFYGVTQAVTLPVSAFVAVFFGLQKNVVPVVVGSITKIATGVITVGAVLLHVHISTMAAMVALVNVLSAICTVVAWSRLARHIRLSWDLVDRRMLRQLFEYCGLLAIWTVSGVFISGLDTTIVGHYDFHATAYYAVTAGVTNFIGQLLGAVLTPLIPAASALSAKRTAAELGSAVMRLTRYATLLTAITALPLLLGGYFLFNLWMGHDFAMHNYLILRFLAIGYVVRYLGMPYANMVFGLGRQRSVVIAAVGEAIVNFTLSIVFARHYGAMGVALGTFIGSFVGVTLHFTISMKQTMNVLSIDRTKLFVGEMLRPLMVFIPALLLLPVWWHSGPPSIRPSFLVVCFLVSIALGWFFGLNGSDRKNLSQLLSKKAA